MPCYHPLTAYRCQDGVGAIYIAFQTKAGMNVLEKLQLPCGQCIGCRERRARDWAIRCMHEASLYQHNCFITLTYNDDNLPSDRSLHYEDFQKFMKRLRFTCKGHQPLADGTLGIRFYMAGEYGENFGRPHYHACLFNYDFPDKVFFRKAPSGEVLYRSPLLEELWPFGFSSIGSVTFKSAAYVARYINKKVTGDRADRHYEYIDPETGEITWRKPEFNKMSLKPGIGNDWLVKYKSDVFPHDYIVGKDGRKLPVPRYYCKKFECSNPYEWDAIVYERYLNSRKNLDDNTPERLAVKKQVKLAQMSMLKRTLT